MISRFELRCSIIIVEFCDLVAVCKFAILGLVICSLQQRGQTYFRTSLRAYEYDESVDLQVRFALFPAHFVKLESWFSGACARNDLQLDTAMSTLEVVAHEGQQRNTRWENE